MKNVIMAAAIVVGTAGLLFAQDMRADDPRGYVSGFGGFATSLGSTTGDVLAEGGVRVARVLGAIGVAHLTPAAQFTFSNGAMPDGSVPTVGTM